MCSILTRLGTLNHQLTIISKLQEMEEEFTAYHQPACRKYSVQNSVGKYCRCACHILSLKEQSNKLCCNQECFSYDNSKKKVPCNAGLCKTRKKLLHCINTRLSEVQADSQNNAQVSKSVSANTNFNQSFVKIKEKQSKSEQVNLSSQPYKAYVSDKTMSTYEEKSEQTIPTRDNFHSEVTVKPSGIEDAQFVTTMSNEKIDMDVNDVTQETRESVEVNYENIPAKDKNTFERIQKDLINERERNKELEKKLKFLTCSLNCLKEDSEQKAACLKGALETAEDKHKLAMDLIKQSKNQSDLFKADKDELLNEITKLQQQIIEVAHANTALTEERDNLENKIESLSKDESKRCEEVEREVNRMKCAVKEKEDALNKERTEFMDMILELINVIKIQKRRICEVTGICDNQQRTLHEKDNELCQKNTELSDVQSLLQSSNCACKELEEEVEHLKYCLCEEKKVCECLKQELENLKDNHSSELKIKEKMVEEQNRTIAKQRKLLHDSEKMAHQAASEFDHLKEELYQEKEKNISLQITLEKTDTELNEAYSLECEKCKDLRSEINYLKKEKQRALMIAKFAYKKFHESAKDYQEQITCEKQQHMHMALIIEKKEKEIQCLRCQLWQHSSRTINETNDYAL